MQISTVLELFTGLTLLANVVGWVVVAHYQKQLIAKQISLEHSRELSITKTSRRVKQLEELLQWLNTGYKAILRQRRINIMQVFTEQNLKEDLNTSDSEYYIESNKNYVAQSKETSELILTWEADTIYYQNMALNIWDPDGPLSDLISDLSAQTFVAHSTHVPTEEDTALKEFGYLYRSTLARSEELIENALQTTANKSS